MKRVERIVWTFSISQDESQASILSTTTKKPTITLLVYYYSMKQKIFTHHDQVWRPYFDLFLDPEHRYTTIPPLRNQWNNFYILQNDSDDLLRKKNNNEQFGKKNMEIFSSKSQHISQHIQKMLSIIKRSQCWEKAETKSEKVKKNKINPNLSFQHHIQNSSWLV